MSSELEKRHPDRMDIDHGEILKWDQQTGIIIPVNARHNLEARKTSQVGAWLVFMMILLAD